jgi:hypothetical protein
MVLRSNQAQAQSSRPGFTAHCVLAQYELIKHGPRKLARLGQALDAGFVGHTVFNNYRLDTNPAHRHFVQ